MAERTPAMPFYGKEFYDDERVRLMPLAAQALYVFLLWRQWQEGSVPASTEDIAALIGKPAREVAAIWTAHVARFFAAIEDGRVANAKLEKIRDDVLNLRKLRSNTKQKTEQKTIKRLTTNSPSTETATATEVEESVLDQKDEFDSVWANCAEIRIPEPVGKKAAWNHFRSSVLSAADLADFRLALANYRASDRVKRGFVQNASTWFNNWRDFVALRPVPLHAVPTPADLHADAVRECVRALRLALKTCPDGILTTYALGDRIVAIESSREEASTYVQYAKEHDGDLASALTFEEWRGATTEAK